MKSVGLLAIFLLLLGAHYDDSIPLYGVGGSFQSQSHHPYQWPPDHYQPARVMKTEYSLPHGPDSSVSCEWTFQEHWFQVSFVFGNALAILAVMFLSACIVMSICMLTFVGLSTVVNQIQPAPTSCQQTGMHLYIHLF